MIKRAVVAIPVIVPIVAAQWFGAIVASALLLLAAKNGEVVCALKNNSKFLLDKINKPDILNRMKKTIPAGPYANHNLSDLVIEIEMNWKNLYFGAVPYLQAMGHLDSVNDNYGQDTGKSIVRYFLCNATTWKGETAREIKKELNKRLK